MTQAVAAHPLPGFLGRRAQNAFVVADIDAAIAHWTGTMGAGPFVVFEKCRDNRTIFYRGAETEADWALAFTYIGEIQIEIVQPLDEKPSRYRSFLESGREGLNHLGFCPGDFAGACAQLEGAGWNNTFRILDTEGVLNGAYYEAPGELGTTVEVVPWTEARAAYFGRIEHIVKTWDGVTRPIRRFANRAAFLASGEGASN